MRHHFSLFAPLCMYAYMLRIVLPFNPLMSTLKPQSSGALYSNTIGTLAVDGWAVAFSTARWGLGALRPAQSPHRWTKCNSPPIDSQCTNFIIMALLAIPVPLKGSTDLCSLANLPCFQRFMSSPVCIICREAYPEYSVVDIKFAFNVTRLIALERERQVDVALFCYFHYSSLLSYSEESFMFYLSRQYTLFPA